jgi:hypothetical protein
VSGVPRDGPASGESADASGLSAVRYDSFVVRVLSRPPATQPVGVQVTHIGTRRTLHFTDLQRIVGFMLDQVGSRSNRSDQGDSDLVWPDTPLDGLTPEVE